MTRVIARWIVGVGITVGGIFGVGLLFWRSVYVERLDVADARKRFEEVRRDFPSAPLVIWDASGRLTRKAPGASRGPRPSQFHVLVYRSSDERLVQADAPLWFLKVKGPAVNYAFRGTGFDLAALGLTPTDLEEAGAGLVLDEKRQNGDRLLAWTE